MCLLVTAGGRQYFTALTASEHLTALVFNGTGCCGTGNLFKPQALQNMLPLGRQLLQLQRLTLAQYRPTPAPCVQQLTAALLEPSFDAAMVHIV
jgi:hypothetical protein